MFVELSHPIHDSMPTFPGLPRPSVRPYLTHEDSRGRYAPGTEFAITEVGFVGNVGTYIDSPFHRFRTGADVSELPLQHLVDLPAEVVHLQPDDDGAVAFTVRTEAVRGAAVLVATGWDRRWGTDAYWEAGPFLAEDVATALVDAGAALVGVDFWNVDDTRGKERPIHTLLLDAGIPVVEHLCRLTELPPRGATLSVAPLAVVGAASAPVRAWARTPR